MSLGQSRDPATGEIDTLMQSTESYVTGSLQTLPTKNITCPESAGGHMSNVIFY